MRILPVCLVALGMVSGCARNVRPDDRASSEEADPKPGAAYLGEGLASFYGPGLHGNLTANGETFDQEAMTAAHRKLKFNTCVRVVNMENGKDVRVRINDRGPYKDNRIIDVSKGAARKLDMLQKGLSRVRLYRVPCE